MLWGCNLCNLCNLCTCREGLMLSAEGTRGLLGMLGVQHQLNVLYVCTRVSQEVCMLATLQYAAALHLLSGVCSNGKLLGEGSAALSELSWQGQLCVSRLTVEGPCLTAYEAVWSSSNVKASPERSLHTLTLMLSPAAGLRLLLARQGQKGICLSRFCSLHSDSRRRCPASQVATLQYPAGELNTCRALTLPDFQNTRNGCIVQSTGGEQDVWLGSAGVVAGTLKSVARRQA